MNMRLILTGFLCIVMSVLQAQSSELMVQGTAPALHLDHTVAAKETWYSIGRIYNISPKEIAPLNSLSMDKPLAIGQKIKIPLVPSNFAQSASKAADEVYVPIYHIVQEKEWMYRLSVNYKAPVENLEKWNNVNKDQVKQGMKMVVGYLKVKTGQSALASKGSATMKTGIAAVTDVATTAPVKPQTPVTAPPAIVKTEPQGAGVSKPEPVKPVTPVTVPVESKPQPVVKTDGSNNGNGGYFKAMYDQSGKSNSGTAGVFKSTSGWQDGKYYALMNTVPVGTIVKVSSSDKVVYAKVLGTLAEMKENSGLAIRLSDAAASQLGAAEAAKFSVDIKY